MRMKGDKDRQPGLGGPDEPVSGIDSTEYYARVLGALPSKDSSAPTEEYPRPT